ncbi:YjgN family protein [Aromatoleum evansii]|uniref:YjgN family protein n=1 Tax=Aromatoleum evansii TaxID=59406 RepID=UPI001FE7EE4A|nr:YjgN family protein [Aromatoleum evansii]
MMAEASYTLVFQGGILDGFEREQVMQRFGQLFRVSAEDVEKIFGHPRVVLKRNLDRAAADAFLGRLAGIGMVVRLDEVQPATPDPLPVMRTSDAEVTREAPLPASVAPQPTATSQQSGASDLRAATASIVPTPLVSSAARDNDQPRELPFEFSGNGFEFFRIWIVNLVLSIVTLGIYSAWAKVRTQRYFYGNTRCEGASFAYLAEPLSILKGRLIAFALVLVYILADGFVPLLRIVVTLVFLAIFPWIMVRGLAFRNHNSAWRGVRFGFDGRLGEAYRVFLLWPIAGAITLGLLLPYAAYRQQQFIIGRSRYGVEPLRFEARAGAFYMIALAVIGIGVGGFLLSMLAGAVFPPLGLVAMPAAYLAIFAVSNVMITNLRYNNTALGAHLLQANYRFGSYAMLMLTNTLALGLTFGLFYPWAKVRSARYAAEHISLVADGDLDAFAAVQREQVSAAGGEIGDLFDVDLGI